MESLKYLPRYTVSDYQLWEGDWELIDGHPVSMSPSPVRRHQSLATALLSGIFAEIKAGGKACGDCEAVFELDWIVNENMVLRPDISIICEQSGDFITKAPILIIEILSPSTALRDKHVKHEIYQKNGVKYYIIADPATKTFQSYVLNNSVYEAYTSISYTIHPGCDISIDLSEILHSIKD